MPHPIGIVAIGRNEGQRLRACLASVIGVTDVARVVYVDSGSTDSSVEMAREMGADVVELDLGIPFTAARARNEGFARLTSGRDDIAYVQFVDGDCQIVNGWIERAATLLQSDERLGVVCGRRRERFPEQSIYNKLCDIEWNTPIGPAKSCGGDAMIRTSAFKQVGGYDARIIAGEEPEMCVRLREGGWTIQRIDAEMTLHDAAMTRFGQWWKRNVRAGHAYAEGHFLHGAAPERMNARSVRSNWVWGLIVPMLALLLAWPTKAWTLLAFALYVVLWMRIHRSARARGLNGRDARLYAFFIVLGKFPQAMGQLQFHLNNLTGRRARIIEYKDSSGHAVQGGPA
jgi:GT2 family glycosyltransferase